MTSLRYPADSAKRWVSRKRSLHAPAGTGWENESPDLRNVRHRAQDCPGTVERLTADDEAGICDRDV